MATGFLFHKNLKSPHSSPIIQHSSQFFTLKICFKLVVVVRHGDVVSPWTMSPSLHTKDNNSKELKYNQTQPNSTEPKMFCLDRSETNQGSRSVSRRRPAETICAEDLWNGSEREWRPRGCWEGTQPADTADETQDPRSVGKEQSPHQSDHCVRLFYSSTLCSQSHVQTRHTVASSLSSSFSSQPAHLSLYRVSSPRSSANTRLFSFWGRFSRRRSFAPAGRAPRPFLWQRVPWRTGTAPVQTHRTRSPSSRWPTAAAWRWTPSWAAFSRWSFSGGISSLRMKGEED